jgi:excisionase family DNA binding protein
VSSVQGLTVAHTGPVTETRISLQAAAERLGVHYQTAYRWVRAGSLPAVKVRGVYQVVLEDLEQFDTERQRPEPPPVERTVRNWERFVDQLHDALVAGEEGAARDLVDGLVSGGVRIADCCDRMISPALRRVGERWRVGEISVAEERRASFICERLLGRINPAPPGRPRGTALVCTPPGDEHQLPGQMATAVLREDHWRVHHFGTGVPDEDLMAMIRRITPDLVVISSVWVPAAGDAEALAASVRLLGPPVLVGGAGMTLNDLVELAREAG